MAEADDWSDAEVLADRLQAGGDPRGELLALELAAERAPDSGEARRINGEAQRIRDAHHELAWPSALGHTRVGMRAGFVVAASFDELADPSIPLELLLSARELSLGHHPLDACATRLEQARSRGLRIEGLEHWGSDVDPPADLGCLRGLGELDARAPALERIAFVGRVAQPDVLAGFPKLRSIRFGGPLRKAELTSLASLRLQHLRLHGELHASTLAESFGDTLAWLELPDCNGSLTPLRELASLRRLSFAMRMRAPVEHLSALTQLEALDLPWLDHASLTMLAKLPLRSLSVDWMPAKLVHQLPSLCELEALTIGVVGDGQLEGPPFAELPRLGRLALRTNVRGNLTRPAGCRSLALSNASRPFSIVGEVHELSLTDCDLRLVPASVLEQVRSLRLTWTDEIHDRELTELPFLAPQLERLAIHTLRDKWKWAGAVATLGALPQLRAVAWRGASVERLAALSRELPEVCVLSGRWPRA
ncbi:MAG TPA: hypothetical protein VM869_21400 [Enhygromyxa sp.]|nr:hypothetical protein [Enhygromyxa sp.]